VGLLAIAGCGRGCGGDGDGPAAEGAPAVLDLWAGMPPLEPEPGLVAPLVPKDGPARPPSVGEVIELPFPPPAPPDVGGASEPEAEPLAVLRFGPTGDRELVDAVRVSFNHPMVPLSTVERLATLEAPLVIEPPVEGEFRWLGTRTVAFYPKGRMPYSTRYRVRVPEGVESTGGSRLAREVSWSFSTPTLEIVRSTPAADDDGVRLDTEILVELNQPVNRAELGAALRLRGGGKAVELRIVPEAEWKDLTIGDPGTGLEPWQKQRILVLRPAAPLAPDTRYRVEIPAGNFGEGDVPSRGLGWSFATYPPLRLLRARCAAEECLATYGIVVDATTDISDPDVDRKVRIEPPVDDLVVTGSYRGLFLQGEFAGETRYRIEVDAGLRDAHGQVLASPFAGTVALGPLEPGLSLFPSPKNPIVLERGGDDRVTLRVTGLRELELQGRAVAPDELATFLEQGEAWTEDWAWPALPPPTEQRTIDVLASGRAPLRVPVELRGLLGGGADTVYVSVRSNEYERWGWKNRLGLRQLVQVTDLGVSAALDHDDGAVLVTRLSTGEPVAGAQVAVYERYGRGELWKGDTDAEGLVRPSYRRPPTGDGVIVARHGEDSAFLRVDAGDLRGQWMGWDERTSRPRAFFFTDREPYKPGETVHLSGVLRREVAEPTGGVDVWRSDFTAEWTVTSPRGIEIAKGEVHVGPFGTFSVEIPTPENGDTGQHRFDLTVRSLLGPDESFSHGFAVEAFRAPEFEVDVERRDSEPLVFGGVLEADVVGKYLHGAAMIGAEASYTLVRADTGFVPPGPENEAFGFGRADTHGWGREWGWTPAWAEQFIKQESGRLDVVGRFGLSHPLVPVEPLASGTEPPAREGPPSAATFRVDAVVTDENRQAIAGSGSFVVHPALTYPGVRAERSVLREGERARIEAIATDLEGQREEGRPLTVEVVRHETVRKPVEDGGRWSFSYETREEPVGRCDETSGRAPVVCEVDVARAGTHVARVTTRDEAGRENRSETRLYVHGADAVVWDDEQRRVDIVPDRRSYAPGDTATLLVRSPFERARGFLVVEREGIERLIPLVIEGGATTVELPIAEHMLPRVTVGALLVRGRVEVAGAPPGQDLGMPGWATGQVAVDVSSDAKRVFVAIDPAQDEIGPGESLRVDVRTTDRRGFPVRSALAVMVVDEGVLSLMGHQTPDPLAFFHHERERAVGLYALHASVLGRDEPVTPASGEESSPKDGGTLGRGRLGVIGHGAGNGTGSGYGRGAAPMEEAAAPAGAAPPPPPSPQPESKKEAEADKNAGGELDPAQAMAQGVSLRTMFATTAYFEPEVETDFLGRARLEIPMPENLTTFRIMVVAVDPQRLDRFGHADATVRVRKPIMLRPSLPRFANLGDRFQASVMVDNQTGEAQQVLVGTRGLNVKLAGETERTVDVPAGEAREVRFDMGVEEVGDMRLQFAALANRGRDATEVSVPVLLPATKEAFADYGATDGSVRRALDVPGDVLPGFGGLEVAMSSTALAGLEDAVSYLVTYPYECAEQTASRVLPIFALGKVLDDFPIAATADRARRDALATDGIRRLLDHQLGDGGFGFWDRRESWPYLSTWVSFALLEGKRAGYAVDPEALERALGYLERFAEHGFPSRFGTYYDFTTRAFALWLLAREGRGEGSFDRIWAERRRMPLYARAMLMEVAHRQGRTGPRDEVLEELREAVVEGARTVHFAESRSEAAAEGLRLLMHSDVQTDAIVLATLLHVAPEDPLLPKVMAGIMSGRDPREGGRWPTTHANAWALVAASRYYETVEGQEPDFVARIWLGDAFAGERAFSGRSMATVSQLLPMSELVGRKAGEITLAKDGPGKLYWRLGLRYAPASLHVPARERGFTAYRQYRALAGPDGVRDPTAVVQGEDGTWRIRAGSQVEVTLTLVVQDRADYVVVDDPFPAGFEGQNPRFVTSVGAIDRQGGGEHPYPFHGPDAARGWWWPWWSFDHTQMRDDRMLLFADHLPAGVYTYSYTARATTIGEFVLPPTHAEAMYEPERFGHSATSRVTVFE
jgi:hypothetical protein